MKRVNVATVWIGAIFFTFIFGCQKVDRMEQMMSQARTDITILAADSLEGRETGTEGEKMAAEYIKTRFEELGLLPKGDNNTFFQDFSRKPQTMPGMPSKDDAEEVTGRNVVGFMDNQAKMTVVLGAHYDHLGWGEFGSLETEKAIHNGADDNASGIASLLILVEELKGKNTNNNYLFIAFSGEEKGLWGSHYFTKNATVPLGKINYMFNMDMVGRLNEEHSLALHGTGTSPNWSDDLDEIAIDSLKLVKKESGIGPSDQTSFYLEDIPVLHFFTGAHEDYHKSTDDIEKLNFKGLIVVTAYIDSLITRLDDDGELEFTKTKDEDRRSSPKFKVTLSVVPDHMFDGIGMRISGVHEGGPAHEAGLLDGDIVIKMGDLDVTDMMSYMAGLGQFEEGEKAQVVVKRGEKEITANVQF